MTKSLPNIAVASLAGESAPGDTACARCLEPLRVVAIVGKTFRCLSCGASVCLLCGCTDDEPCAGGCYWIAPGLCSAHEELYEQVAASVRAGLREARTVRSNDVHS
jgi:hypothetical protein